MELKDTIQVVKDTVNKLNPDKVRENLTVLAHKAIGKTLRNLGWSLHLLVVGTEPQAAGHVYTASLTFAKKHHRVRANSQEVFRAQLDTIRRKLLSSGRSRGWVSKEQALVDAAPVNPEQGVPILADVQLPPEDRLPVIFGHIFDRESQTRIIYRAAATAITTGFSKRHHCLLYGLPGCGKTELLLTFAKMVGEENVLKLDATMTSKAGLEQIILDLPVVPPFIILEEAEKCSEANLPPLLGIMDNRGEINKTNARVGNIRRQAKCMLLATVNNMEEFSKGIVGPALASRFSHKIYCPRPTRKILEMIAAREIKETGGDPCWIKPALDYVLDEEKVNDPRRVRAVLLDGRERLLDQSYQADQRAVRECEAADLPLK